MLTSEPYEAKLTTEVIQLVEMLDEVPDVLLGSFYIHLGYP